MAHDEYAGVVEAVSDAFAADLKRIMGPNYRPRKVAEPSSMRSGWQCPNCGKAHAPTLFTCPEPPKQKSLKERIKVHNG